jgi:hypothetical protein
MNGDQDATVSGAVRDKCTAMWPMLSVYADSEASDFERHVVESHLEMCSTCLIELDLLKATSSIVRAVPDLTPPPAIRNRILSATIYRKTFAGWLAYAVRSTLAFRAAQFGTVALAGVIAAVYISWERSGRTPEVSHFSPSVASAPRVSDPRASSLTDSNFKNKVEGPLAQEEITPNTAPQDQKDQPEMAIASAAVPLRGPAGLTARKNNSGTATTVPIRRSPVRTPAYKVKSPVSQPAAEDIDPDPAEFKEPVMMPVGPGMVTADMKTLVDPNAGVETTIKSPSVSRIQLSASSEAPSEQVASLAGLKQALKQQSLSWNVGDLRQSMRDKQIHIDLIKRSF